MGQVYSSFFLQETPASSEGPPRTDDGEETVQVREEGSREDPPSPTSWQDSTAGSTGEDSIADSSGDADRINVGVKCKGKLVEVDVYPMEKISVLKQQVCDLMGCKQKNMQLVYNGEIMKENSRVQDYKLRGGAQVNLIGAI